MMREHSSKPAAVPVASATKNPESPMGVLYDIKRKIDQTIEDKKLDGAVVRGKIALQTGFLLSLLNPTSPDDPAKTDKLKKAAEAVLQIRF
jgi:hypothetical protein